MLLWLAITVGLLAGVLADYLLVRYGWKPAVAVVTLVVALAFVWLLIDVIEPINAVAVMLACSSTQYFARPLLRRRLGRV